VIKRDGDDPDNQSDFNDAYFGKSLGVMKRQDYD
jgi:hypothetical protein